MSTDSALNNVPLPDDALAALMASRAFQAQMAALTQQAAASLQALVAALRATEAQLAAAAPALSAPIIDIPYGPAVEPVFLPWIDLVPMMPQDPPATGWGAKLLQTAESTGWGPLARLAVEPSLAEIATDMLAVLPQPAAGIAIVAASPPAAAGSSTESEFTFVFEPDHRAGGEGGTF